MKSKSLKCKKLSERGFSKSTKRDNNGEKNWNKNKNRSLWELRKTKLIFRIRRIWLLSREFNKKTLLHQIKIRLIYKRRFKKRKWKSIIEFILKKLLLNKRSKRLKCQLMSPRLWWNRNSKNDHKIWLKMKKLQCKNKWKWWWRWLMLLVKWETWCPMLQCNQSLKSTRRQKGWQNLNRMSQLNSNQ